MFTSLTSFLISQDYTSLVWIEVIERGAKESFILITNSV